MDEFHQCDVCLALVTGPHACSPIAIKERVEPKRRLTEEDVRRIVREELAAALGGGR